MTIHLQTVYPMKPRELFTKRDKAGQIHKFVATAFVMPVQTTIRVYGLDDKGIWCTLDFKAKLAPKWLRRALRDAEQMQASQV
jgi:hypothetical protein